MIISGLWSKPDRKKSHKKAIFDLHFFTVAGILILYREYRSGWWFFPVFCLTDFPENISVFICTLK
jgi:hypothetical protein